MIPSTSNRKKRRQINPKQCVQYYCKVYENNFQGKKVECQICFEMSHTCSVNIGGNFICCLNCKICLKLLMNFATRTSI